MTGYLTRTQRVGVYPIIEYLLFYGHHVYILYPIFDKTSLGVVLRTSPSVSPFFRYPNERDVELRYEIKSRHINWGSK